MIVTTLKIGAVYSTAEQSHFRYEFYMEDHSDYSAELVFECGQSTSDLFIDNVADVNITGEVILNT